MKTVISTIIFSLFLFSCKSEIIGSDTNSSDFLSGKWKLVEIVYGYPAPNSPTSTKAVEDEIFEFDTKTKKYSLSKKGKISESGTFSLEETNDGGFLEKLLVFQPSNSYSTYSYNQEAKQLILYQRTPVGAKLADGSNFYYEKMN